MVHIEWLSQLKKGDCVIVMDYYSNKQLTLTTVETKLKASIKVKGFASSFSSKTGRRSTGVKEKKSQLVEPTIRLLSTIHLSSFK